MRRSVAAIAGGAMLAAIGAVSQAPAAPEPGERLFRRCVACHALEPGRNTPAGPTLHDILGRRIAAETGFNYSPALRRLAVRERRWTARLLDRFIADPDSVARGTEMGFPGMADAAERRA